MPFAEPAPPAIDPVAAPQPAATKNSKQKSKAKTQ
jgi:hypothetical protein